MPPQLVAKLGAHEHDAAAAAAGRRRCVAPLERGTLRPVAHDDERARERRRAQRRAAQREKRLDVLLDGDAADVDEDGAREAGVSIRLVRAERGEEVHVDAAPPLHDVREAAARELVEQAWRRGHRAGRRRVEVLRARAAI